MGSLAGLYERHPSDPADSIEPEDEEEQAGLPALQARFAAFLTLDSLAGGDVLRYPAVLATDAETILTKLQLEAAKQAYQYRLRQLRLAPKTL